MDSGGRWPSNMSAYENAVTVDPDSSEDRVTLAADLLQSGRGEVLVDGMLALRPMRAEILCEVIDPDAGVHRCSEEYKVLVENAGRALAASRLGKRLPSKPLRWLVVEDHGTGTTELWCAP
jgi:hypothetical protein